MKVRTALESTDKREKLFMNIDSLMELLQEALAPFRTTKIKLDLVSYPSDKDSVSMVMTVTGMNSLYCFLTIKLTFGEEPGTMKAELNTYVKGTILFKVKIYDGVLFFNSILNTNLKKIGRYIKWD